MKTAAQVWLQYGRDLNVDAAIKGLAAIDSEIERLRAALKQIVAEAESDDGLSAWDGSEIARKALAVEQKSDVKP